MDTDLEQFSPNFNFKKGLLPAGTDIAMLFDVFEMIINCEDETLFGGEATLDKIPPLECQVATEAKITTPLPTKETQESVGLNTKKNVPLQPATTAPPPSTAAPPPPTAEPTAGLSESQQVIGGMVEDQVDKAKGEIDTLIPKIEDKVLEQEKTMQGQLSQAEEGLVGKADVVLEEKDVDTAGSNDPTSAQKMMGTVVESAVDKAKGEIDTLIPKIEDKVLEQEKTMQGQLSQAEEGLVGKADVVLEEKDVDTAGSNDPTSAQKMMGTVVESAVDKAKGQIDSLMPSIENEIVKQEKSLETKLKKAEKSMVEGDEGNDDDETSLESNTPTAQQKAIGSVVESAVDKAKDQINSLIPTIEDEIMKQEEEMDGQLSKAESALLLQTYVVQFVVHVESQEKAEDVAPVLSSNKVETIMNDALGNQAEVIGIRTDAITAPK